VEVGRKKILIVDDEPAILIVSRRRLEANGYEVITAESGKEGIEKAVTCEPDLVLLDIIMPGLDGYEVCRRLKSSEKTREIPVIIFTASSPQDDSGEKAIEFGAVGYLTKPFESDDLLSIIERSFSGG
jgi:CheY-like chemotaxis protein